MSLQTYLPQLPLSALEFIPFIKGNLIHNLLNHCFLLRTLSYPVLLLMKVKDILVVLEGKDLWGHDSRDGGWQGENSGGREWQRKRIAEVEGSRDREQQR